MFNTNKIQTEITPKKYIHKSKTDIFNAEGKPPSDRHAGKLLQSEAKLKNHDIFNVNNPKLKVIVRIKPLYIIYQPEVVAKKKIAAKTKGNVIFSQVIVPMARPKTTKLFDYDRNATNIVFADDGDTPNVILKFYLLYYEFIVYTLYIK